ncbi:Riboflavin synthase [Buchnera aphidicola (Thelaxes suberi)]|uniref:riboflavin synthase subunit alpha n=1 Tax=Buchnera aphidicola TaxID=9 RepID=UPI003463D1B4
MFTGIVLGVGKVIKIVKQKNFFCITIKLNNNLLSNLRIGDSISNNGCCLTVTSIYDQNVTFDIIEETLNTTNLKYLRIDSLINIERALKINDELGGHLVSGHVSGTVVVSKLIHKSKNMELWLQLKDVHLIKYIFEKGFICINGVSLTINRVVNNFFSVFLIPATIKNTNFIVVKEKDILNIEIDHMTQIIVDTVNKKIRK